MATVNLVPVMTSANTPSGVVTCNGDTATGYLAFDGDTATYWDGPDWGGGVLTYQFSSAMTLSAFAFTNGPSNWNTAGVWGFYGSNNGTDWTQLDYGNGDFSGVSRRYERPLTNPGSYSYYKFNVEGNQSQHVWISEIELIGDDSQLAPAAPFAHVKWTRTISE